MPRKKLKILVAGGFDPTDPKVLDGSPEAIISFATALGKEIMRQGHILLTGCQTELDKVVACSAQQFLESEDRSLNKNRRIISYVLQGQKAIHNFGTVMSSERIDWDIGGLQPTPPETIREADVVILIGGFYGTFKAGLIGLVWIANRSFQSQYLEGQPKRSTTKSRSASTLFIQPTLIESTMTMSFDRFQPSGMISPSKP